MEGSKNIKSEKSNFVIDPKLKNKKNFKIWNMSLFSILCIVLILLFFILSGYSLYNSYEGVRINQGDLNELKKASDILKELQEKTRLYFQRPISTFDYENDYSDSYDTDQNIEINSYSIGRFKRDASRVSTQQKQNVVKGKRNEKRQVFRGNALTDCFRLREECFYMINSINSNLKAAEIALANIQNVIWRIQPLDANTRSLLTCLQCSQYGQQNTIPNPTSLYSADLTAPENLIPDNYNNNNYYYYMPAYYTNPIPKNNPVINNNNYKNPYTTSQVYGRPNTLKKNMYSNYQPNVYIPTLNNNPIPYNIPYYYKNNNPNYQIQNPSTQNIYVVPTPTNDQNFNYNPNIKFNNNSSVNFSQKNTSSSPSVNQTIISSNTSITSTEKRVTFSTVNAEPTRFTLPIEVPRFGKSKEEIGSGSKVRDRMTTRETKNKNAIKHNYREVVGITEDPALLKTLQLSSLKEETNQGMQSPESTSSSSKSATANNSVSPFMCYWPLACFFNQASGQPVQAPESTAANPLPPASRIFPWNPANLGSTFGSFNPFIPSEISWLNPRFFGPSGPGGNLQGRSSVNQPVLCSHFPAHISPNDFQEKYGHRDSGKQDNKETDPRIELKNLGTLECPENYVKCYGVKKCILQKNWCDGIVDCEDSSDEIHCTCKDRIAPNKLCDGFFDCPRGEDELGCYGCGNDSFSCLDWTKRNVQGKCVPLSQRCDGEEQCRNGRDEKDCYILTESYIDNNDISTIGHSSGYLFKNWFGKWYPVCTLTEAWADKACRSEIGSLTGNPTIKMETALRESRLGPYISMAESGNIELTPECNDQAVFVKCPSIPCGSVVAGLSDEFSPYEDFMVASPNTVNATTESAVPLTTEAFEDLNNFERISGDGRVVGGRASHPHAWPFLVAIYRDGYFYCGGSIINERWILTAAHCTESYNDHYYQIFAGLSRRFSFSPMAQIRQAQVVIPHPEYNGRIMRNDLALIKLNEPLRLNRWIRATCLPSSVWGSPPVNETCTTVGWGATSENGPDPDYLRQVEVPIAAECNYKFDRSSGIICAGWSEGGRDACQGDSGGPLMCRIPIESSNRWYIAGIVSHGEGCARPNKTGAYTRVSYYLPWINKTMNSDNEPFGPKPLADCPGFKCHEKMGKCLPFYRRCDKKVDCLNAEDETNCYHFYKRVEQTTEAFVNQSDEATPGEVVEEVAVKDFNSPKAAEKPVDNENFYGTVASIYPDENSSNDQNETDLNTTLRSEENVTDDIGDARNEISESSNSRYDYDDDIPEIDARAHKNNEPTKDIDDTWKLIENTNDFICSNITQVISKPLRCDKKIDCEDGTDELNCRCIDILTIKHPLSICDGRIDCADKSDELYCNNRNTDQDTYLCPRSAVLIPAKKRCDRSKDCELHDDEKDCYALTNGEQIELDVEGSTILKKNGIVSINRNNLWSILCFNNRTDLGKTADDYCDAVGFYKHESASFHPVNLRKLEVHLNSENSSITFDPDEVIKRISPEDSNPSMCHALYVDCKMNFKEPVDEYLYKSNVPDNDTYLLPWEPAIFVDGKYHCPALLLNTEWAMTSTHCTNDINLDKNITAIIAGLSIPHQYVDGPHQQTRMVNHIENLDQFHTSLLHFDKLPVTRYVKPIFINNRPLAATEGEHCQATGVNKKLEKQSVGFNGAVEDCPSCKRCFRDVSKNECPKNGTMGKWSGFISCHNSRGWYPAAVFHERDILCEFEYPQALTGIEEMLPHLTTVMDQNYFKLPNAQCDADGMKCTEGKCLPFEKICDGIQDCRDGSDENEDNCLRKKDHCNQLVGDEPDNPLCGCSSRQLRCESGNCISKDLFCDGYTDCEDGSDEPLGCSCRDYLRLTSPHRLCNKVRDCFDKSDEAQEYCGCSNDHYECSNSTMTNGDKQCIPYDFVCDGHKDCLHGEDESLCRMIQSADDTLTAGRVLKRQLGVWFDECFPHPINSDQQAAIICTTMGYSSGVLLDEKSRSAYPPPQTIQEAPYYTINLNGLALIILKDDLPSAVLVSQRDECNRAFIKCFE
ncbi:GSCOCG00001002001-RA-CDS [Cotesia congregata]|uniref:limulus clotting factor C n=1 Tax=Cotesia congregata TaxID=51543 RepID=A0A8J2HL67_COTCN|nr:GSCOCG00001002001-RA-CDS [Cotesia congregata]CAG5095938.1 Similar to ndl: Serine protease nudel (Drosophila melanogaster) [Cotesia congregata]